MITANPRTIFTLNSGIVPFVMSMFWFFTGFGFSWHWLTISGLVAVVCLFILKIALIPIGVGYVIFVLRAGNGFLSELAHKNRLSLKKNDWMVT